MREEQEHYLFDVFRAAKQFGEANELYERKHADYQPGDDVRPYRRAAIQAQQDLLRRVERAESVLDKR